MYYLAYKLYVANMKYVWGGMSEACTGHGPVRTS